MIYSFTARGCVNITKELCEILTKKNMMESKFLTYYPQFWFMTYYIFITCYINF